jgi:hypothetical protein
MTETVQTVIAKFAKSIIDEVKSNCMMGEEDFRTGRFPHHTRARVKAMRRLKEAGFTHKKISIAMRLNIKTVEYWLCPRARNRQMKYAHRRYETRRAEAQL